MLLKDSLGGASMTLMIACVAPSFASAQESSSTLRFASRAKKIQNKPVVQIDPAHEHVIALKREVDALRDECAFLRRASRASSHEASDTGAMGELAHELVELKKMLQEAMSQSAELRHENVLLAARKDSLIKNGEEVMRDNAQLLRIIEDLESRSQPKGKRGTGGRSGAAEKSVWDRYPRAKTSIANRIEIGGQPGASVSAKMASEKEPIMLSPISKGTLLSFDKGNETLTREMASGELARALQGVADAGGGGSSKGVPTGARGAPTKGSPGGKTDPTIRRLKKKSPRTLRKQASGPKAQRTGTSLKPALGAKKRSAAVPAKSGGSSRTARTVHTLDDPSSRASSPREMSSVSPPRGRPGARAYTYPSIEQTGKSKMGQFGGRSQTR